VGENLCTLLFIYFQVLTWNIFVGISVSTWHTNNFGSLTTYMPERNQLLPGKLWWSWGQLKKLAVARNDTIPTTSSHI
jgi:hypothetical protein